MIAIEEPLNRPKTIIILLCLSLLLFGCKLKKRVEDEPEPAAEPGTLQPVQKDPATVNHQPPSKEVSPAPMPEPKGPGPRPPTPKAHMAEHPPRLSVKERTKKPQPRVLTKAQLTKMLSTKRDQWIQPARVIQQLGLKPGTVMADVGCGSGYWTFRLREAGGKTGLVYAVDFDPNALDYLKKRMKTQGGHNISVVLSRPWDTRLKPRSVDLAFLVNVHFFKHPKEPEGSQVAVDFPRYYKSIHQALRPGGKMVIIEPDKDAGAGRHVSVKEISRQLETVGFRLIKKYDYLKLQYFLIFRPMGKK